MFPTIEQQIRPAPSGRANLRLLKPGAADASAAPATAPKIKPLSDEAIVALAGIWASIEAAGGKPTIRIVTACARAAGIKFTSKTASQFLSCESLRTSATQNSLTRESLRTSANALRAGARGSQGISLKLDVGFVATSVATTPPSGANSHRPRQTRMDTRSEAEIEADTAIGQLRPAIQPALSGLTWSTWRQRNRRYVVDMARAGMSAAEIVAAHKSMSERFDGPILVMSKLQDELNRPEFVGRPEKKRPRGPYDVVPYTLKPHERR